MSPVTGLARGVSRIVAVQQLPPEHEEPERRLRSGARINDVAQVDREGVPDGEGPVEARWPDDHGSDLEDEDGQGQRGRRAVAEADARHEPIAGGGGVSMLPPASWHERLIAKGRVSPGHGEEQGFGTAASAHVDGDELID
jgi:hypothetical protein